MNFRSLPLSGLALALFALFAPVVAHAESDSMANMADMMRGLGVKAPAAAEPETTGSLGAPNAVPAAAPRKAQERSGKAALGYEAGARSRFRDLIARHAAENGVPFELADAIVRIESRYDPTVSNGGAVGLMQIKTQTARGLGYEGGAAGLKNPETNVRFGMKYLAQAYRMSGGDTCATVMRYQSGHYATRLSGANRTYCNKARTIMAAR